MPQHPRSDRTSTAAYLTVLAVAALACPGTARGQGSRFFPDVPSFEYPAAAPRATAFVGRILSVQEGDTRFGTGKQAEAGVGESFPVIALRRGPRPITLGFGVETYGRFNLDDSRSSLISTDWVVGIDLTADLGRWRATLRIYHESSHLGDEYAERFDATRLDWTREVLEAWVRYTTGPWSFIGAGTWVLVDEPPLGRPGAMLAVDYVGSRFSILGAPARPVAAVHFEGAAATDWRIGSSGRLGIEFPNASDSHALGLSFIAYDGRSTQRQFFQAETAYLGGELRFDF